MNKYIFFKQVDQIIGNIYIQRAWFVLLFVLCLIPSISAVLNAPIHCDSAYYLSSVERINEGFMPYIDFPLGYTPFVMYLLVFLKRMFSIGINYEFYLTIHFIFQFLCAFFVYKISNLIIKRKDFAYYASLLFIMTSHWNEGNAFLLETPSLLFGLMATYFSLKYAKHTKVFFGIGIFAALSFLSKQYGFGFVFLIAFLIWFNSKRLNQFMFLFLGFSLALIICYLIWGGAFMETIKGNYGIKSNFEVHFLNIVSATWYFFSRIFPVLLIGLLYLPYLLIKTDKQGILNLFLLIFAIFGFMCQFYFWQSMHYFLYIIPFASILSFYLFTLIKRYKWIYTTFLISTIFLSFFNTYFMQVYKTYYKHPEFKKDQYFLSQKILANVSKNKTLFVADIGLMSAYYLTNMIPVNFNTVGYSFGPAMSQSVYIKQIDQADYIINYKPEFDNSNTLVAKTAIRKRKIIGVYKYIAIYN